MNHCHRMIYRERGKQGCLWGLRAAGDDFCLGRRRGKTSTFYRKAEQFKLILKNEEGQ